MSKPSDHEDADMSAALVSILSEELGIGGSSHCDMVILSGRSLEGTGREGAVRGSRAGRGGGGGVNTSPESGSSTITYSDEVGGINRDGAVFCDGKVIESTDDLLKFPEPGMGGRDVRNGIGGGVSSLTSW